jgi:membrane-associated phospholipid phosphatase
MIFTGSPYIIYLDKFYIAALILLIGYLVLRINKSRILDYLLCLIIAGGVSESLKFFINKPRPVVDFNTAIIFEGSAFPSTHTTIMFAAVFFYFYTCSILSKRNIQAETSIEESTLPDKKKIVKLDSLVLILLAIIGGLLRIIVGAHFPVDILAGAVLGILIPIPFRFYDVTARRIK